MAEGSMTKRSVITDRWDIPDLLLVPMESLDAYLTRIATIPALTADDEEHMLGTATHYTDPDAGLVPQ